jgi:hypothetical protein
MHKAGTVLIYCYSMFGLRQRDCLVSDGKGGLLKIDNDYACGYEPPHYPVPAIVYDVTPRPLGVALWRCYDGIEGDRFTMERAWMTNGLVV